MGKLTRNNYPSVSLQSEFHRRLKVMPFANRTVQGHVMECFREVLGPLASRDTNEPTEVADLALAQAELATLREQLGVAQGQLLKARSRAGSAVEVGISTGVGMAGSWAITFACVSHMADAALAATVATLGCTVWSLARGYTVRRYFANRIGA